MIEYPPRSTRQESPESSENRINISPESFSEEKVQMLEKADMFAYGDSTKAGIVISAGSDVFMDTYAQDKKDYMAAFHAGIEAFSQAHEQRGSHGPRYGKDSVLELLKRNYPNPETINERDEETIRWALVLAIASAVLHPETNPRSRERLLKYGVSEDELAIFYSGNGPELDDEKVSLYLTEKMAQDPALKGLAADILKEYKETPVA